MIVGFTGTKGSGKDTAASFAPFVEIYKFADPLKAMLATYLSYWDVNKFDAPKYIEGALKEIETKEFGGKTTRWAMQSLGTEWGRNLIHDQIWVDIMKHRLSKVKELQVVAVTDVRFLNEAKLISQMGGKLIRIVRPDLENEGGHISETEMKLITPNITIVNDGDITDLRNKVKTYLGF